MTRPWRRHGLPAEAAHDVTAVAPPWAEGRSPRRSGARRARPPRRGPARLELQAGADVVGPMPPASRESANGAAGRLGRAGRGPGDAGAPSRAGTALVHVAADVRAPGRECAEQLRPDPRHLGRASRTAGPTHARAAVPTRRADGPRRPRGGQAMRGDTPPVAGTPAPVRRRGRGSPARHGCGRGVAVPADAVREHRRDRSARGQHLARGPDRRVAVMACCSRYESDPPRPGRARPRRRARPRLRPARRARWPIRRTEGQVEGGHGHPSRSEHDPGARMAALSSRRNSSA